MPTGKHLHDTDNENIATNMNSRPPPIRATSVTREQNQNHDQNQPTVRTRSRLALPEFNIDYDRSPLKNAREALRRANARFGQTTSSTGTSATDHVDVKIDAKMNDVLARVGANASSNPFRSADTVSTSDAKKDMGTGDVIPDASGSTNIEDESSSTVLRSPSNPFNFSTSMNDEHPKYPKRPRSISFDNQNPPSLSGSGHTTGGVTITRTPPVSSPPRQTVEISSMNTAVAHSDISPPPTDSTPTANAMPDAKRAKVGMQGTLDAFFSRSSAPSSSSSSSSFHAKGNQQKQLQLKDAPARRIFSATSPVPSSYPDSTSTPPQTTNSASAEEAIVYPKTPTVKQLRELPTLDLRTITPSPRKRALQLGFGTPGPKPTVKSRVFSAGAALMLDREELTPSIEIKEEMKRAASELREDGEHAPTEHTHAPLSPPLSPKSQVEEHLMDIDNGPGPVDNRVTETASGNGPPTITISTSTSTIAYSPPSISEDTSQHHSSPAAPAHSEGSTVPPHPSTPQHKIIPSRPLPSGRLPSTKSHLSKLLSLSPLTPLSALGPLRQGSDEYDYEEEERRVQEENKRADAKRAAKLVMQEEAEMECAPASPIQSAAFSMAEPSKESTPAPPTVTRKPSSKGKHKGKVLSSTSRVATTAAGVKKRKSLVSVASVTPRMRLTRASVLRQKAIQAQMRSPRDGKRRSSIFGAKNTSSTLGVDKGEKKDKVTTKEGSNQKSEQKEHAEPEPQRSPRKTFVLTVPSSLSPRKSSSTSSSANSSVTHKSNPVESGLSKPFTFSLYPPSINDIAATEQAQRALNKLSSALDKLAMPPPSKPNSSNGVQLRRPASEQRERIRPATSLGFTREMSVPISGTTGRGDGRPRAVSRAGSAEPTKKSFFPPPPPPTFGSSLMKDKGKGKLVANASRTVPVTFGAGGSNPAGVSQMRPPSSFRFGLGSGGGMNGIFGRPIPRMRASQKTSLETVQGSPVKGGGERVFAEEAEDEIVTTDGIGQGDNGADADASVSSSNANGDTSVSSAEGSDMSHGAGNAKTTTSGKELKRISRLNASRRASMAFSTLAQSLGTSPDTFYPFAPKEGIADDKTPTNASNNDSKRSVSATSSSSASGRPIRAVAPRSFIFGAAGLGRTQSESAVSRSARARSVTPSAASESDTDGTAKSSSKKSGGGSSGRTKMPGSLDVLDQCTVFVDVRTEEGEDAGALFVDMLRGLGAKVLTRVGQTCTHIVYKNGLASTLTRYRLLDEPRPEVVGIGWVVECAEKRSRADETRFQVDLETMNVAGTLKRRRSFLPKQILSSYTAGPMDAFLSGAASGTETQAMHPVPKACADSDVTSEDGDTSQERAVLSGGSLSSDIHPLERARRRNVVIPR